MLPISHFKPSNTQVKLSVTKLTLKSFIFMMFFIVNEMWKNWPKSCLPGRCPQHKNENLKINKKAKKHTYCQGAVFPLWEYNDLKESLLTIIEEPVTDFLFSLILVQYWPDVVSFSTVLNQFCQFFYRILSAYLKYIKKIVIVMLYHVYIKFPLKIVQKLQDRTTGT